jgi:hypothetical protein
MDALLKYGHLLGVVLLLLGTGVFLAGSEGLRRSGTHDQLRLAADTARLGTRLLIPGGLLLLGFGIALAARRAVLTDPWLVASAGLVVLLGINGLRAERWLHGIAAAIPEQGAGPPSPHLTATARHPVHHGATRAAVVVLPEIEFLMTVKPAAATLALSLLLTTAVAGLVALTARTSRSGRSGRWPARSPAG